MDQRLRFIQAQRAKAGNTKLGTADVRSSDGARLGGLDGFIVDPECRRVRYVVIDTGRWLRHHRYLVPMDEIRLDSRQQALLVDNVAAEHLSECREFHADEFPTFSENDVLTAMFRRSAA